MITLGGNISLDGFDDMDPGMLIVVKKIVGLFAKKVSENIGNLDAFEVRKADKEITVRAVSGEKTLEESSSHDNPFVALSNALTSLEGKSKQ